MAKSYTEELAQWVNKREPSRPRQDKNVVAFLAVRADVKAAIDAGYARKTIWEHLHETGKIPYRYETFLKHVRRHITNAPTEQVKPATTTADQMMGNKPEPKAPAKPKTPESKKTQATPGVGGFKFDATPKKEDLI